jgi:hypothetical protein
MSRSKDVYILSLSSNERRSYAHFCSQSAIPFTMEMSSFPFSVREYSVLGGISEKNTRETSFACSSLFSLELIVFELVPFRRRSENRLVPSCKVSSKYKLVVSERILETCVCSSRNTCDNTCSFSTIIS